MKCRYTFAVHGGPRLSEVKAVQSRGRLFEFEASNGILISIAVTVILQACEALPQARKIGAPGENAHVEITIVRPHFPFIRDELRALQGLLSLYGIVSLDIEHPKTEWIPESAEEKATLSIYSHQTHSEPLHPESRHAIPFDLIARAVIAADAATEIEIPLNFFRKGMLDIHARAYIEAIYDFYFVLETLFGGGQFKKSKVVSRFRQSAQLCACIKQAIS